MPTGSTCAETAVHTALRLMKPQDVLKILHVAELDVAEYNATDVVKKYQAVVEAALVDAEVVLEQKLPGKTVAQQICAFVSASNAHYLVMGVDGMARFVDKGPSGTVGSSTSACVEAARCTVVVCKERA